MASILTWDHPVCSLRVLLVAEWVFSGDYGSQSKYMHIRTFDDSELGRVGHGMNGRPVQGRTPGLAPAAPTSRKRP